MASFKRGQAPATCNFCEKETKIKWKCINCDVFMCAKCKDKIHAKLKNNKDHKVIDIKEVGLKLETPDFSDLKCESHRDQSCVLFCTTCQMLVCTSCITKFHNGHGFVEIIEGYELNMEKIRNEHKKAMEIIDELTKGKREMSHIRKKDTEKYKELKKKIEAREIYLKNAVEKFVKELKEDLIRKWREFQKDEINHIDKVVDNLQELSLKAEDILQSNVAEKVFNESAKLAIAVSKSKIRPGTISFLPGQMSPYNVGSLQVVSYAIDVRIVKQFQTDISRVFHLSSCPGNSLWISDDKVLQKVKPVEYKLTVESTFDIDLCGMFGTPTGDLLVIPINKSVLKQISGKTGELTDSIYNLSPLYPTSVHVTIDGKVVVGVKSGGPAWPVTGRRAIIVMNQKGEHDISYEHDKNNIRIFTYVRSITSTDNGNICVVDKLAKDGRGTVVVLNRDGDILQIYTGHHEVNIEDKPFQPVNIVTTPSDNIIVKVLSSDIFHILNNCGQLITHYNVGDLGITMSYSLCFTRNEDQLYIGCSQTNGGSGKIHVYEVKISGC